jgi:ABC-type multidrug transport system fused ATPase/permease subunit
MEQLRRCYSLLDTAARRQLGWLGLFILINTLLETLGIGMFMPFIALINQPDLLTTNAVAHAAFLKSGMHTRNEFLILAGGIILVLIVTKNIYLHWLTYRQARFVQFQIARIAKKLLTRYMAAPYRFHIYRNSAELISTADYAVDQAFLQVIQTTLFMTTEMAVVISLVVLMLVTEPLLTLVLAIVLGGASAILVALLRPRLTSLGKAALDTRMKRLQNLQQSLSSVKEIKVLDREQYFISTFDTLRQTYAGLQSHIISLTQTPRQVLEAIIIGGLLLVILVILLQGRATSDVITVLGLFAVAAFRMMPALYRILVSYNEIKNGKAVADQLWKELTDPAMEPSEATTLPEPLTLNSGIELKNLSFSYEGGRGRALHNVSLAIAKGESIGLVGTSGAGKTTLADVILGLLQPDAGTVLIDGVNVLNDTRPWRRAIGYVPQTISLIDDTLRNNIALGVESKEIDDQKIWHVLRMAHLAEFCRSLPDGLSTSVGERGVRLSGGQKQRIGIARALYHAPRILIMDEATSSLDNESEYEITRAIEGLQGTLTMVIVAHRLSTVKKCDRLILMRAGTVVDEGSFNMLVARNSEFRDMVRLADLTTVS